MLHFAKTVFLCSLNSYEMLICFYFSVRETFIQNPQILLGEKVVVLLNILYLGLNRPSLWFFFFFCFALPLVFICIAISFSPSKTKVSKKNKNQNDLLVHSSSDFCGALIFVVI